MIGITAIASYIPDDFIDNKEQAIKFGEDSSFAEERIGAKRLPVKGEAQDTSDLAVEALESLIVKAGVDRLDIDCLVVCTQNPDGSGLPHVSALVQAKAGLSNSLAAFDISLGCSGFVYGVNVVKGFMESAGLRNGILITADPYSKIVDKNDRNTAMLFGDAAVATLLTDDPVYEVGLSRYCTDGEGASNLVNNSGVLHMNGRQVFNFASSKVPVQIKELLHSSDVDLNEVDRFLLHQGSKHIVSTITRRLGVSPEKVPCEMVDTGNTVSSSIALLLLSLFNDQEAKLLVLSGFGVGLSWASLILKRKK